MGLVNLPCTASTVQGVHHIAKRDATVERWVRRERLELRGAPVEYLVESLPAETIEALIRRYAATVATAIDAETASSRTAAWEEFENLPAGNKREALKRCKAVSTYYNLIALGARKGVAHAKVGEEFDITENTLRNWLDLVKGKPSQDWALALAPDWVGRKAGETCSADAWQYFKNGYLIQSQPNSKQIYRSLKREAKIHGWTIPKDARTMLTRLEREVPAAVIVLLREGDDAAKQLYPHQRRDRMMFHAMEAVNSDGHMLDVEVLYEDGTYGRPVLIGIQDLFSGKIIGWHLGRTETTDAIRLAFGHALRTFGGPKHAYLDNGRAFAAKMLTGGTPNRYRHKVKEDDQEGILNLCGTRVHWVKPYSGQSKPIERAWRDLASDISRDPFCDGAYVGNRPGNRPANARTRDLKFEDFKAFVTVMIHAHNAREGRKTQACGGKLSFDEAFKRSYEVSGIVKLTPTQERMFLLASNAITASRKDGRVKVLGNEYWSEEMPSYRGKKVVARYDPENLYGGVYVHTLSGEPICHARCEVMAGFADTDSARQHGKARNSYHKANKAAAKAEITMVGIEAQRKVPIVETPPVPKPAVIEGIFNGKVPLPAAVNGLQRDFNQLFRQGMARDKKTGN
jgi:putative transposase